MMITPEQNQTTIAQHAAAAKLQAGPLCDIGTRISKQFDEVPCKGTTTDYDADLKHCKIQCDNGDEEEMDKNDMNTHKIEDETEPCSGLPPSHHTHKETLQLEMTLDMFGPSTTVTIPVTNNQHLGFTFHKGKPSPTIEICKGRTPADSTRHWQSRFRHGTMRAINGVHTFTIRQFEEEIDNIQKQNKRQCHMTIAHEEVKNLHTAEGVPQSHFDQLNAIAHHLHAVKNNTESWTSSQPCPVEEDAAHCATINGTLPVKLTRRIVMKQPDWDLWEQSEFKQHDACKAQNMFGEPIPPPQPTTDKTGKRIEATMLPFVWTCLHKDGNKQKARGTCNGGKQCGKAVTLAHTHASCVEQPAARLFHALAALEGMTIPGADASNAFAEAPAPVSPLHMKIDEQFNNWWTKHKGRKPLPKGWVLPVKHALQGHLESPRLWEMHVNKTLKKLNFKNATHERNMHSTTIKGHKVLFLQEVDNFSAACTEESTCPEVIKETGKHLSVPLHLLGRREKFNGVDASQTQDYVKMSCQTHPNKVLDNHQWQKTTTQHNPVPMRDESECQTELETATPPTPAEARAPQKAHFNHRQAIGEATHAMVTCRPDMSHAVIKLSQHLINPLATHCQAVRHLFIHSALTKDQGMHYWQKTPREDLPHIPHDTAMTDTSRLLTFPDKTHDNVHSCVDSDWGDDKAHRRSATGMAHMMAGGVTACKSKFQATVALSSTEAEFTAAAEAGKTVLHLQSILQELGHTQHSPTTLHIDNQGALFMADVEQPTRRTRHMDTMNFTMQQWTKEECMTLEPILTENNA